MDVFNNIFSLIKRQFKMGTTHQNFLDETGGGWRKSSKSVETFHQSTFNPEEIKGSIQLLVNTILDLELVFFLRQQAAKGISNKRNGRLLKKLKCSAGTFSIVTPRDRNGEFNPIFIKKWKKQLTDETLAELASILSDANRLDSVAASLHVIFNTAYPKDVLNEMAAEISRIVCGE